MAKVAKAFGTTADTVSVTILLPGPEREAVLAGEGDLLLPEDVTIDGVAADTSSKSHEAEADGEAGKALCSPERQEGEANRILCHEDERDGDDLHGDEKRKPRRKTRQETPNHLTNYIITAGGQL